MLPFSKNSYCYDRWLLATVGLLAVMFLLVIKDQFFFWNNIEDYNFGLIVPVFALFVIYDRRAKIAAFFTRAEPQTEGEQSDFGSWLENLRPILVPLAYSAVGVSLAMFSLGSLIRTTQGPTNLASLMVSMGFGGALMSLAFVSYHTKVNGAPVPIYARLAFTLLFLFPAAIWLLSTPMLVQATGLELRMQGWVAVMVEATFAAVGEPLVRLGNTLILPNGEQVLVAEACSGIRSLTACMFAGSFLGAVFLGRFWKKVTLVGLSVCFAFGLNFIRSLFLTIWASVHGSDAIELDFWGNPREVANSLGEMVPNPEFFLGTVHDVAGYGILAVTFLLLLSLLPLLNFQVAPPEDDGPVNDVGRGPGDGGSAGGRRPGGIERRESGSGRTTAGTSLPRPEAAQ